MALLANRIERIQEVNEDEDQNLLKQGEIPKIGFHNEQQNQKEEILEEECKDQELDTFAKEQFAVNLKIQDEEEEEDLRKKKALQQQKKQFVVVTGQSGFDLDEIFGFDDGIQQQEKRLTIMKRVTRIFGGTVIEEDDHLDLYERIPKSFAYYIIAQSVLIGSSMTPWLQCVRYEKYIRLAWRFMFQALMLIPFVLYEHRSGGEKVKNCYRLRYIFQMDHIRKLYLSNLNTIIQMTAAMNGFEFGYIANVVLFSSMTNFWLSVTRGIRGEECHFIEQFGRVICVVGTLMISWDTFMIDGSIQPASVYQYINSWVFKKPAWQRVVIGYWLPITMSLVSSQLSRYTMDIKTIYPPFLSMFIISWLVFFHLVMYSYFVDASSLDTDKFWGWFGLFTEGRFSNYMYMSVILNFGLFMTQMFITKLFEPIIPAASALSEPIFCSFLLDFVGVQAMPGPYSLVGMMTIMPGQFIIILGQHLSSKENEYKVKIKELESRAMLNHHFRPSQVVRPSMRTPLLQQLKSDRPIENEQSKQQVDSLSKFQIKSITTSLATKTSKQLGFIKVKTFLIIIRSSQQLQIKVDRPTDINVQQITENKSEEKISEIELSESPIITLDVPNSPERTQLKKKTKVQFSDDM